MEFIKRDGKRFNVRTITEIAILAMLNERPMYGTEMVDEISKKSNGGVQMNLSTLYSALKKMDQKQLIRSYYKELAVGGRCRVYNITGEGRDFYNDNLIEIDYALIAKKKNEDGKVYGTLEEAFEIPLSKVPITKPKENEPEQILFNIPLEKEETNETNQTNDKQESPAEGVDDADNSPKLEPYIMSADNIIISKGKKANNNQMAIAISGTRSPDIFPLQKLNLVNIKHIDSDSNFLLVNKLRYFSGGISAIILAMLGLFFYFF
ncbi:MAG: PadR family transcriptional regulator, partial [Christensenellaceae bacterium]|nr:PadR family transcriptional regulator [Christensenellaceae bacterium]